MAIGRVAGPLLFSNLDRQGVDLQFSTDNAPLLYLDFANFRAAINANTLNTTDTFTVNGSSKLANIKIDNTTVSSDTILTFSAPTVDLGNISQLTIAGGGLDYVMTTNGAGELSWQDLGVITSNISLTGDQVLLSSPTDGSLTVNSAYRYWTGNTSVTNAVDNLNQVMLNGTSSTAGARSSNISTTIPARRITSSRSSNPMVPRLLSSASQSPPTFAIPSPTTRSCSAAGLTCWRRTNRPAATWWTRKPLTRWVPNGTSNGRCGVSSTATPSPLVGWASRVQVHWCEASQSSKHNSPSPSTRGC